ncbi:hypothetical protein FK178_05275 [Antarcticibacterium arcticum]|uniref:Secreted protein n=1 Tax=Antarcticibacterium arcticum TaxID=2585771 RepID=A0A5B8YLL4_9FLAO|nr:hypothetical protein [Antarcticibacterium arcticum]QED37156.1 hypothetical protein FK178_05275 [Antarcticibacterium arcticum]
MKLLSILLSLLVLFSTSPVTMDAHYCSGKMIDFAFNKKARSCSSDLAVESEYFAEDTCCSNKTIQKTGQKDLKVSSPSFQLESFFCTVPPAIRMNSSLPEKEELSSYYYKPPLIKKDYQVLFEVFLI